jgi:RND family efflux transporter MFP subunit
MKKIFKPRNIRRFLVFLAVCGVFFFFLRNKNNTVLVRKAEVKNRVVNRTTTSSGTVRSKNEANLSFQSSGKIQRLLVKKGDEVKKGQLLARLDTFTQENTVQSYRDARDIKIRQRDLFVKDMYENQDTLGGEAQYDIKLREYNENVDQAEASYQVQLGTLRNMYIYAPFSATVTEVSKEESETATASEVVIKLADLSTIKLEIQVDQEDYGMLKEGQAVEIKLDSFKNVSFEGKVMKLPLYANESTDNFEVDIEITPKDGYNLRIGMQGDAYILLDTTGKEVPSLTFDEISYDEGDKPYVWVVESAKIKKMSIKMGIEGDVYSELKDANFKEVVVSAKDGQKMIEGYTAKVIN